MRETVIGILKKNLELKTMEEDVDTWYSIENDPNTCVPVGYGHGMVVYQDAYFLDVHEALEDVSIVLYSGGTAVGIWPLSVFKSKGKCQIGSWGGYYCLHCCVKRGIRRSQRESC